MPFTVLDDYPPFPASLNVCCACGAGRRTIAGQPEKVVSLGFPVEIAAENGAATGRDVYAHLCQTCATELGGLVGLITPADADSALERAVAAAVDLDQANDELRDLRAILDPLLARLQADDPAPAAAEEPAPAPAAPARRRKA